MGTGMAFPWRQIAHSSLASGRIAEDVALGLQLALDGHPPQFHPGAIVVSEPPPTAAGRNAPENALGAWLPFGPSRVSVQAYRGIDRNP